MKHIDLDADDERIKEFVLSLPVEPDGAVLTLGGEPVLRVLPIVNEPVDPARLKTAILRRRGNSRRLNEDWQAVDREVWDEGPALQE
ncbi:MAG TPA: hypothetical protein VK689_16440 [Armatimonadota bacterium]|nr:hypothetical protein [Armatimonadota bacterium]